MENPELFVGDSILASSQNQEKTLPSAFLSHASADAAIAQKLCAQLEAEGVRCWIAPRDVTPGRPYSDEIVRGIDGCEAFVLLATPTAVLSKNVLNELEQAHRNDRQIYTIMVNQPKVSDELGYYIARLHWLEAKGTDLGAVAERLAQVMHGVKPWEAVAAGPTLGRKLRSALPAFGGSLVALLLVLALLAGLGAYAWSRTKQKLAHDYRSVGWLTLQTMPDAPGNSRPVEAHIWLGDAYLPLSQTRLLVATGSDASGVQDLSRSLSSVGTGAGDLTIALPRDADSLSTFLSVPQKDAGASFCVEQHFHLSSTATLEPVGEPLVSDLSPGSRCVALK